MVSGPEKLPPGKLPEERLGMAIAAIAVWRQTSAQAVPCPACATDGLEIVDRSARTYAEWYVLLCKHCGLDHTLHLPTAPPQTGYD